ncbi:MAG TPA: GldG family protein [Candidatus Limnocylindrales bacterium]|nr:GldG family protein [Candidatus Limnocylindrales bacterium]
MDKSGDKKPFEMQWTRQEWAEIALSIGTALLIAGYIRYSIQGELLRMSEGLLIGGGVVILAAAVLGFPNVRGFFSKRSSQLGTNTLILTAAVLAILVVANYLGHEYHKRFDMTSEKLFTLSDQTKKIVKGLTTDVTIARFAKTSDQNLNDLMAEYKNLSPHIRFENVDPQEKPEVAKEFGATHMGDVIAQSGDRKLPIEPSASGDVSEQDITSTILKITNTKVKMVCFVTGHGEKALSDDQARGYNLADQGLKKEGFNTNSVNLVTSNGVPSDCDVLVIAGPQQSFFPQETAMVSKYLDGGGKALIEEDPISEKSQEDPKLEDIFQAWNINVGTNVVVDASGVGRLFGTGPAVPLVVDYGDSPITKNLEGGMTFFPLARTVSVADKNKPQPQDVELLKTSARSFTIPNLDVKEVKFDPKTDTAGPLSLGVAGSQTEGTKEARLVVIGDSDFAANQWITLQHNGDLFYNTIDWLAQDENLISIRPKSVANRRVTLTQGQSNALWWLDLFVLPGLVVFSGIYIWWKRR